MSQLSKMNFVRHADLYHVSEPWSLRERLNF